MTTAINSIYMSLPVPVPNVDPGPQFATDLNTCLTIIDSHTHAPGQGQQITPNGISINQDLPFFNNNAVTLRSVRFQAQNTPISQPSDLRCLFSSSSDLYYNDSAGNQVRLTQNGGVAGTPGSIGGLLSPASVSYIAGSQTFVFQSSTATPANIDIGAVTLREIVANSKGITIAPPAGLANNYSLTLFPILPTSGTRILTVDSGGNIGDSYNTDNVTLEVNSNALRVKNGGISQLKLSSIVNYVQSDSSGNDPGSTSTTPVQATNLNVSFTNLAGRPVEIYLSPSSASSGNGNGVNITKNAGGVGTGFIYFYKNGASMGGPFTLNSATTLFYPLGGFRVTDFNVSQSESVNYSIFYRVVNSNDQVNVYFSRLTAREI